MDGEQEEKRKGERGNRAPPWMFTKVNLGSYWNLLDVLSRRVAAEMRGPFEGEDGSGGEEKIVARTV